MLVFSCKEANIVDIIIQELFDSFSYSFATGEQGSRGIPGLPGEPGAKGPAGGYQLYLYVTQCHCHPDFVSVSTDKETT